ncbi:MAG: DUF4982 domain-containing protein [Tannerellaceae bacterium]|nr:DUF4982 domain-containing protein [Tannerellaceae bacterium]
MKNIFLILCLFAMSLSIRAQVSFGDPQKLNDQWKFYLGDPEEARSAGFDDEKWRPVDLPHDWSVQGQLSPSLASGTGFLPGGIGWYRKTVTVPQSEEGRKVYLYFEGVYNRSEVFINGQSLGKRPNGYISFMYDATPFIEYGKENTIAVRVDHSRYADSRWYTGSGIYRNVWLVYANPVHIDQWGVYVYPSQSTKNRGKLMVEVEVKNETGSNAAIQVVNELYDATGKKVAQNNRSYHTNVPANSKGKISTELTVSKPQLWDLNHPYLYTLHTTVLQNGKEIDKTTTKTGFRTYTFDPDKGFALNGEWMKVKGVCIHHDAGVLGAAVPREVWRSRLLTLKEIGCNAIRTSHNPQAPDLYELCDELGLLVMNEAYDEWEFPKRKWIEGWNVGTPGFDGAYDYFEEWGEQDLIDMVLRDRNHLSVFAWSIGNEVDYPNDPYSHPILDGDGTGFTQKMFGGYQPDAPDAMRLGAIAKRLTAVVKQYDTTRPVTAGLAGVAMSNETEYPGALDIAGYNYTESRYQLDHEKYPKRVIYGSENRHDMEAWKAVRDNQHIFGQFLWTGIDYLGESGRWPSRGFYSGLVDFAGYIKPRGYFRKALWSDEPTIYLGTYIRPGGRWGNYVSVDAWPLWNYEEGQEVRVVCYTNAAKARLELNGTVVGEEKPSNDENGVIHWDIPYKAGKLEVVGLDNQNRETGRTAIQTSGRPYALTITGTDNEICKEKGVAMVKLQVVDEKGIPVMLADDMVTCRIEGPGKLLGLEAGNNSDMTDYTDNVHRTFQGRILAYIQAQDAGQIKVQFTSPWLKPIEVTIQAK